jgi:hypothetical protein
LRNNKNKIKLTAVLCLFWATNSLCFAQSANNHLFELAVSSRTKNTNLQHTRPLCLEFGKTFQAFQYSVLAASHIQSFSVYYHYESNLKGQNSHGLGFAWYSVGKDDPNSVFLYQRIYVNLYESPDYQQYSYLSHGGGSTGVGYAIDEKRSVLLGINLNDYWKPYLELAYHHIFYVPKKALMTKKMKYRRAMKCLK